MVSITNSVIFLFELELKQFKLSKILPIWKIGVYMVLIINNKNKIFFIKIILSVIFIKSKRIKMILIYTSKV
jgi:hypothetical protein